MAKLVPWNDLRVGMEYVEEWRIGSLIPFVVLEMDKDRMVARFMPRNGVKFSVLMTRNKNSRYWDATPTDEEMKTPWGT